MECLKIKMKPFAGDLGLDLDFVDQFYDREKDVMVLFFELPEGTFFNPSTKARIEKLDFVLSCEIVKYQGRK